MRTANADSSVNRRIRTRHRVTRAAVLATGAALAGPAHAAALPTLEVSSTGSAITVTGTPATGAVRFTYRYTGDPKGQSNPEVLALKPGVDPNQFIAGVHALRPNQGPEPLLAQTGTIVTGQLAGAGAPSSTITKLKAGTYVVLDAAGQSPASWPAATFTGEASHGMPHAMLGMETVLRVR
jgi:hypothetical protein